MAGSAVWSLAPAHCRREAERVDGSKAECDDNKSASEPQDRCRAIEAVHGLSCARPRLVGTSTDLSNQIRSALRTFGLRVTGRAEGAMEAKVREQMEGRPEITAMAEPLPAVWRAVRVQVAALGGCAIRSAGNCQP